MEKIIVAFESEKTALRVKELLEGGGAAACLVCRTADQVRRAINKLPVPAVVCGYKLGDQTAELFFEDLPPSCAMLVLAHQDRLDLLGNCWLRCGCCCKWGAGWSGTGAPVTVGRIGDSSTGLRPCSWTAMA